MAMRRGRMALRKEGRMTTAGTDRRSRERAGEEHGAHLNPIDGLLAMAEGAVSDETREVLAQLPADYFERFRHYAYAPPWGRESDAE